MGELFVYKACRNSDYDFVPLGLEISTEKHKDHTVWRKFVFWCKSVSRVFTIFGSIFFNFVRICSTLCRSSSFPGSTAPTKEKTVTNRKNVSMMFLLQTALLTMRNVGVTSRCPCEWHLVCFLSQILKVSQTYFLHYTYAGIADVEHNIFFRICASI